MSLNNQEYREFNNTIKLTNSSTNGVYTYNFQSTKPNMGEEKYNIIHVGKEVAKKQSAYFGYKHSETDPKITLGLHSVDNLLLIGEKQADIKPSLTCAGTITAEKVIAENITATETRLTNLGTDVNNKANKGHTHTISEITDYKQSEPYDDTEIKGLINDKADKDHTHSELKIESKAKPSEWNYDIVAMKSNMENNQHNLIYIGKIRDSKLSGYFGYRHSDTDPRMTIGLHSANNLFTIGEKRANITPALTCASTITADKIESTNIGDTLKKTLLNMFYPVGSVYISMINKDPAILFGGSWQRIKDKFLYCVNELTLAYETGGSKKISVDQLPAHNHEIYSQYNDGNYNHGNIANIGTSTTMSIPDDLNGAGASSTRTTYTKNTGKGKDYMPPYITTYAWYRFQ